MERRPGGQEVVNVSKSIHQFHLYHDSLSVRQRVNESREQRHATRRDIEIEADSRQPFSQFHFRDRMQDGTIKNSCQMLEQPAIRDQIQPGYHTAFCRSAMETKNS